MYKVQCDRLIHMSNKQWSDYCDQQSHPFRHFKFVLGTCKVLLTSYFEINNQLLLTNHSYHSIGKTLVFLYIQLVNTYKLKVYDL